MADMTNLQKVITTANSPALLPLNDLEPAMYEELLRLQPLAALLGIDQASGLTHEYRLRTSHPLAWFEGETTPANIQSGAYTSKTVKLKIQRIWGSVTGFAQAVTAPFINALAEEVSGSVQGMGDLMEYGALYGAADDIGFTGDPYQYSGLFSRLYAYAPENVVDGGGAKITLDMLDQAIALQSKHRQTRLDPGVIMMGLRMKQIVDGLQTKVQIPLTSAVLADGRYEMSTYSRKPIYETDYLVPESTTTSPAVTAVAAAGGALPDATYKYQISSVTVYGEQVGGTVSADVVTATTNNSADLSWTGDANAKLYYIWRKTGAGAYQLLDIIPAKTYDAAGTVTGLVETYSDEGAKTPKAVKPLLTGEQHILIANTHPSRGARFMGLVDEGGAVPNPFSFVELARTKDTFDYFIKGYLTLKVVYPNLFASVRHVKLA